MSDDAAAAAAKAVADADAAGVARATELFAKTYDGARPAVAAAAPGRVNLIGEHTDYNDGWVFPLALEKSTYMVGARRAGGEGTKSRVVCEAFEGDVVEFDVAGDVKPLSGDRKWANYVVGMVAMYVRAAEKAEEGGIPAFDAAFVSDVPIGGGVSSSAALEVRVADLTCERGRRREGCLRGWEASWEGWEGGDGLRKVYSRRQGVRCCGLCRFASCGACGCIAQLLAGCPACLGRCCGRVARALLRFG